MCNQNSDKSETTGLSLFSGFGSLFGGKMISGIGGEYTFYNSKYHHIACIGGLGYSIADDETGWSTGGRYGIGRHDRFVIDLVYGSQGYDGVSDAETGNFTTYEKYYGASILFGYQRITPNGFEFISAVGFDDSMTLCITVSAGYKIW